MWPQWWSFTDVSQHGVDFSKKIRKIKIIFRFDFHRCSQGLSKIGYHFRKQWLKNWSFQKMTIIRNLLLNWYHSMKKNQKDWKMIFDIENWLWKSDLGTFWRPKWTSVKVKSKIYLSFTDFFAKSKPLLTHVHKTPPLRSH